MITLKAVVYTDRKYLGKLSVEKNGELHEFDLVAQSDPRLGLPDVLATVYGLKKVVDLQEQDDEACDTYGLHIIYFESVVGGSVLALHGGDTDNHGNLLPTEGSLRVSNSDLFELVELLAGESKVTLDMREEHMGLWQRAFAPRVSPLSAPRVAVSVARDTSRRDSDDSGILNSPVFWLLVYQWYTSNSGVAGEVTVVPPFSPGGGTFGGAGASGDFETPAVVVAEGIAPPVEGEAGGVREEVLPLIVNPFAITAGATVLEVSPPVVLASSEPAGEDVPQEIVAAEAVTADASPSVTEVKSDLIGSSVDRSDATTQGGTAY